jgi:Protein of unknown function (DUF3147)
MLEYALRFLAGGIAVSAFAALSDTLRPKSFAGLFGAAPSIAMATLLITVSQKGTPFAALEGRSMIVGAFALAAYSWVVCVLLKKFLLSSWTAAIAALVVWLVAALLWNHRGSNARRDRHQFLVARSRESPILERRGQWHSRRSCDGDDDADLIQPQNHGAFHSHRRAPDRGLGGGRRDGRGRGRYGARAFVPGKLSNVSEKCFGCTLPRFEPWKHKDRPRIVVVRIYGEDTWGVICCFGFSGFQFRYSC